MPFLAFLMGPGPSAVLCRGQVDDTQLTTIGILIMARNRRLTAAQVRAQIITTVLVSRRTFTLTGWSQLPLGTPSRLVERPVQ